MTVSQAVWQGNFLKKDINDERIVVVNGYEGIAQPTCQYTSVQLKAMGMIGVYGVSGECMITDKRSSSQKEWPLDPRALPYQQRAQMQPQF